MANAEIPSGAVDTMDRRRNEANESETPLKKHAIKPEHGVNLAREAELPAMAGQELNDRTGITNSEVTYRISVPDNRDLLIVPVPAEGLDIRGRQGAVAAGPRYMVLVPEIYSPYKGKGFALLDADGSLDLGGDPALTERFGPMLYGARLTLRVNPNGDLSVTNAGTREIEVATGDALQQAPETGPAGAEAAAERAALLVEAQEDLGELATPEVVVEGSTSTQGQEAHNHGLGPHAARGVARVQERAPILPEVRAAYEGALTGTGLQNLSLSPEVSAPTSDAPESAISAPEASPPAPEAAPSQPLVEEIFASPASFKEALNNPNLDAAMRADLIRIMGIWSERADAGRVAGVWDEKIGPEVSKLLASAESMWPELQAVSRTVNGCDDELNKLQEQYRQFMYTGSSGEITATATEASAMLRGTLAYLENAKRTQEMGETINSLTKSLDGLQEAFQPVRLDLDSAELSDFVRAHTNGEETVQEVASRLQDEARKDSGIRAFRERKAAVQELLQFASEYGGQYDLRKLTDELTKQEGGIQQFLYEIQGQQSPLNYSQEQLNSALQNPAFLAVKTRLERTRTILQALRGTNPR